MALFPSGPDPFELPYAADPGAGYGWGQLNTDDILPGPSTFPSDSHSSSSWFTKDTADALKSASSDIGKMKLLPDQAPPAATGGGGAQTVRGQGPSLGDLLKILQERRARAGQLGLQAGGFAPRAPGGGLLGGT